MLCKVITGKHYSIEVLTYVHIKPILYLDNGLLSCTVISGIMGPNGIFLKLFTLENLFILNRIDVSI